MKKQMITLAMTMLIGTTSVFGDATSVQAAENNLVLDGSQMTEEIAERALGQSLGQLLEVEREARILSYSMLIKVNYIRKLVRAETG